MNKKRIKLPSGKLVRKRPDKLRLFFMENQSLTEAEPYNFDFITTAAQSPASSEQQQYNTEDFDISRLAGCEVTILGAGSVGSFIAWFLSVAKLILNIVDFKDVEPKHTKGGRTVYEATSIGLNKVDALKKKIERDHLGSTVNPLPYNVAEIPSIELKVMFERSAVVVIAIDDPVQLLRAADLAYPVVEFIQVALHRGAKSGHIVVSTPFVGPCLRCTLGIDSAKGIHQINSASANSFDIVTVAQMASKIAADIIYSKVTGQNITRWNTSKNLIYVSNTKQQLTPEGPGIIMESSSKRQNCSTCNL